MQLPTKPCPELGMTYFVSGSTSQKPIGDEESPRIVRQAARNTLQLWRNQYLTLVVNLPHFKIDEHIILSYASRCGIDATPHRM